MQKQKFSSSVGCMPDLFQSSLLGTNIQETEVIFGDKLCSSNNQNVFLTANSAKIKSESAIQKRLSSDLLIIERHAKHKSKKYLIRLKDIERYDQILRQEACVPKKALLLETILPLPKKNSAILKFFKTISTTNFPQISPSAIFKFKKSEMKAIELKKTQNSVDYFVNLNDHCQKYNDELPSEVSLSTLNYNSTKSSLDMLVQKCSSCQTYVVHSVPQLLNSSANIETVNSNLNNAKSSINLSLENSSNVACMLHRMVRYQDHIPFGNLERNNDLQLRQTLSENIKFEEQDEKDEVSECISLDSIVDNSETNLLTRCRAHTILLHKQQSKLSVCDDDDGDSD